MSDVALGFVVVGVIARALYRHVRSFDDVSPDEYLGRFE